MGGKRRLGTRRGPGTSWYVDETYLKVRGRSTYLYRAIDRGDGGLVDAMVSEHRDTRAEPDREEVTTNRLNSRS